MLGNILALSTDDEKFGKGSGIRKRVPEISVVICTFNRERFLRNALESIIYQDTNDLFTYEVIVIDNGSKDGTKETVENVRRKSIVPVKYFWEEKKGIPYSRNRGIQESQAKWIAFFDDDQIAAKDWLKSLLAVALERGACIVGGSIFLDLKEGGNSKIGKITREILGETNHGPRIHKFTLKTLPDTGNILIKRTVFEKIGGFDISMSFGGTDTDLVRRAFEAGLECWYAPGARVYHLIRLHRVQENYLKWTSLRWGANIAYIDRKRDGAVNLVIACIARIGQALLINLPIFIVALMKHDNAELIDRKCLLWRALGFTRMTLFLIAPSIFLQKRLMNSLRIRDERILFVKD